MGELRLQLPTGRVVGLPCEMADFWDVRQREVAAAQADVEACIRELGDDGRRAAFTGRLGDLYRWALDLVERDPALDAVERGLVLELAAHKLRCGRCRNAYCREFDEMLRVFGGLALMAVEKQAGPWVEAVLEGLPDALRPAARGAAESVVLEAVRQVMQAMTGYALEAIVNAARRLGLAGVDPGDVPAEEAEEEAANGANGTA